MRLTISVRIFFALTAVCLLVVTLNAAVTRWTFERGLLEYVSEQELEITSQMATQLAALYRTEGNWNAIRDNRRTWHNVMRDSSPSPASQPMHGRPPGTGRGPGPGPGHQEPPLNDPMNYGRRISLLDADGSLVIGLASAVDSLHTVPVMVDGTTVGFVGIAPQESLTDQLDRQFLHKQERSIYVTGVVALLLAALISVMLARHLARPIQSLKVGAQAISDGDYATRIPGTRNDELGDLASEFNLLAETLEANQQSRKRWVADIAHELRTPLSVLRGELDAIEDGIRTFDDGTRQSLQVETERLTRLVGELHELSVYDEGGQGFSFETVDVAAALREVVAGSEQRLADHGIDLQLSIPEFPLVVRADVSKLERVFLNLVENTLRYTEAPGVLQVNCSEDNGQVSIEFADSAPGASADDLQRLFDRLFRVDNSRSRETGGSGLGLAICKSIVEAHDGHIEAHASELGGLSVRIILPFDDNGTAS